MKKRCPEFLNAYDCFTVAKCLLAHIMELREIKGSDMMSIYSFADVMKQKPFLKTKLKNETGGYTHCEVKLYSWGKGTVIKAEGVNIKRKNDKNVKLIFEDCAEYICNPCGNGYLFEIFFSDKLYEKNWRHIQISLVSGEQILASNKEVSNRKT